MQIPVASTITLVMELFIGSLIFSIIYDGYVKNIFSKNLAIFAIGYEIVFNVGYMIYRTIFPSTSQLTVALKIVAASHGVLSLIMLFVIVGFFLRAKKEYSQNINSFAVHKFQTILFSVFWMASLISGIFLYVRVNF
jgi:predicted membrane protein